MKDFLKFSGRSFLLLILLAFISNLFTPIPAIADSGGTKIFKTEKASFAFTDLASFAVLAARKEDEKDELKPPLGFYKEVNNSSAPKIKSTPIKTSLYSYHRKSRKNSSHLCSNWRSIQKALHPQIRLCYRSNC